MNFKNLLDEAFERGEKIKADVMSEIFKSRTIKEIVTHKQFVKALGTVIETKDEVKKALNKQFKHLFDMMDVPTQDQLKKIGKQLTSLESVIDRIGSRKIAVKSVQKRKKAKSTAKSKPAKRAAASKSKAKKVAKKTTAKKTVRKSAAKKKSTAKKTTAKKTK